MAECLCSYCGLGKNPTYKWHYFSTEYNEEREKLQNNGRIEFVRGEEVEARDDRHNPDDLDASHKGKFICEIEHEYKYVVEMEMSDGPLCRKYIRKLPQVQEGGPKKFTENDIRGYSVEEQRLLRTFLRAYDIFED